MQMEAPSDGLLLKQTSVQINHCLALARGWLKMWCNISRPITERKSLQNFLSTYRRKRLHETEYFSWLSRHSRVWRRFVIEGYQRDKIRSLKLKFSCSTAHNAVGMAVIRIRIHRGKWTNLSTTWLVFRNTGRSRQKNLMKRNSSVFAKTVVDVV